MDHKSLLLAAFMTVLPASATTITFGFTNPAGDVGSSVHTYTSTPAGYSITAYGFTNGHSNHLYGKTAGGDESGLGLVGTSDHEISSNDFVIFDISQLLSFQSLEFMIGSVQSGEKFNIYGGNTLNGVNTQLVMNGTTDFQYFSIPNFSKYKYIGVTAPSGDVLINSIRSTSTVPEPSTFGLAGAVLAGVYLVRRRLVA